MLLLGTLEQFNLAQVLQRLETHAKSGLLVVKQGEQWVEFYFQQGRLLCIGPVRTQTTLEDRLVQAGVISTQARQEALSAIGAAEPNETRVAMKLLELGCVSREALRAWAAKETTQVLELLLTWSTGEIYFKDEDEVAPPTGRLLVALSVASLLTSISAPAAQPAAIRVTTILAQEESTASSAAHTPDTSDSPPLASASQLFSESIPMPRITTLLSLQEESQPLSNIRSSATSSSTLNSTLSPPTPIATPVIPRRIDTSFMRPEMILVPADLTSLRERNPQLQLTPEQWRLFAQADGRTSLQMACQALGYAPELVCLVAGELIALGLVYISLPAAVPAPQASPVVGNPVTSGSSNRYAVPATQPRVVGVPTTDALPYPSSATTGRRVAVNSAYARAGTAR